jgi:SAM-dependent methyltransferase
MTYKGHSFKGIDSSKEFVKICKSKNLDVIEGDMCNLPFNDKQFDAILSIASFHHLSTHERRNIAIREMERILKPSGLILLSVWSINQPEKTRRKFHNYGDTLVSWNKDGDIYQRYYYIFEIEEIKQYFIKNNLTIVKHIWDYGNEIFFLKKN